MAKNTSASAREPQATHDANDLPDITGLKFEPALAELEQLVRSMEDGRLPLEESTGAAAHCSITASIFCRMLNTKSRCLKTERCATSMRAKRHNEYVREHVRPSLFLRPFFS